MIKQIAFAVIFIVLLGNVSLANTDLKVCTKKDAIKAEELAANVANWDQLYRLYKSYYQCDDGAIAEGFSESVSVLLLQYWDKIDTLLKLTRKDNKFEIFILNHLDETVPAERIQSITNLATNRCPSSAKTLCERICKKINGFEK